MHQINGDGEKAIQAYQDGQAIRELLAKRDPNNSGWQRNLMVSYAKLSRIIPGKQKHYLQEALSIALSLNEENRLYRSDLWMIDDLKNRLESASQL